MALFIAMTFGQDGSSLDISDRTIWASLRSQAGYDIQAGYDSTLTHHVVLDWYTGCMCISTSLFICGLMSVVETLDRVAVTPTRQIAHFMSAAGNFYWALPNLFFFSGVLALGCGVVLRASIVLPSGQFILSASVLASGIALWLVQFATGVTHSRRVTMSHIASENGRAAAM